MLSATSLLLSLLLSPAALAFPNHDPLREIALTDMSGATTLGTWTPSESGVSLSTPHSHGRLHYWIPDDSNNHLSDGMVRARFQTGTKPDFTLLLRAWAPPGEPERLYAYGLSVEKGALALYQWTDGVVSAMGQRTPVDNWSAHTHIELVVTVLGPQIIAIAYDADTLTEIASLSVTDSALTSGRVGLRAHATQSSDTILTQLSLTAPRADIAQSSTPGLAQPGNERLVVVSNADASRIPTGMSFKSRFVRDNELWLVTNRIGVERIRRSGITPLSVSSDVPRFAIDPAYRKRMDQPMTPTKSGFRLDESYKDVEMVAELLQGWTERYPDIARVTPIGTSHQGRPILALRITDNPHIDEDEPAILLNAAHHGSELLATEYCLDAIATVLESDTPQTRRWIKELDLWFVPMVNPDGNWTHLRLNHNPGRLCLIADLTLAYM